MEIVHHWDMALGWTSVSGSVLSCVQVDGGGKTKVSVNEQRAWQDVKQITVHRSCQVDGRQSMMIISKSSPSVTQIQ